MTVSSTIARAAYTGNGTTTAFAFSPFFVAQADLLVILTTTDLVTGLVTETLLILNTDYTITGTLDSLGEYSNGGTVNVPGGSTNVPAVLASNQNITIIRSPSPVQEINIIDNEAAPASAYNGGYDYLTMLVQRCLDLAKRSLRLTDGTVVAFDPTIPQPFTAGDVVQVNPSADGFILSPAADVGGGGTVSSVGLSMPADFAVGNSPVTTAGVLAVTWNAIAKNLIFAGPVTGSNAAPGFRAMVAADLPVLNTGAHSYRGNNTGSSAPTADITNVQLTADLNLFTTSLQGLVPASGGGTTNFLRADGTWAAPPGGGGGGGISTITGNTTGSSSVATYFCNTAGGAFTFTLPAAASNSGYIVKIKNTGLGSGNNVTIARTGSDQIEGGTSATLTPGDVITLQSDGTNYWQV